MGNNLTMLFVRACKICVINGTDNKPCFQDENLFLLILT